MKVFSSFILGVLLFVFGTVHLLAAPSCDRSNTQEVCQNKNKKSRKLSKDNILQKTNEEKAHMRSLRRKHTKQAYEHKNAINTDTSNDDSTHSPRGKKMSANERCRLRQQIDEVGQSIYHQ